MNIFWSIFFLSGMIYACEADKQKREIKIDWKDVQKMHDYLHDHAGSCSNREKVFFLATSFRMRKEIDEPFLTEDQYFKSTLDILLFPDDYLEQKTKQRIKSEIYQSLKEAIEHDKCGGIEWCKMYGTTPEDMTPPTPNTLRKARLETLNEMDQYK